MIVLSIQQEISTHNSDTYGDYYEDDKHQQHETIDVVHLVVPEGSEYEVHLNEDAAEGEKSTHQ